MFCGKCGKENADDVTFCVHCGADLARQTPPRGRPAPDETVGDAPTRVPGNVYDGKLLAGQYRVVGDRPIGSGGMGEVWKAEDTELGTTVAIKVLPPIMAHDEAAVEGLRREATIGRALAHPNICRLYGLHSDGDVRFIVMEYVEGRTLSQVLAERPERKMGWAELEPIARQIADALDYAHGVAYTGATGRKVTGVLHRDIKPANIMVTPDGTAKLMDFGIAREIHNTMTRLTGQSSQTPLYASPEQFRGEPMTPASDIYSFAAVLYEALAGRPYISPHGDLRYQILEKPFEPLDDQRDKINATLQAALAKSADGRPKSGSNLVRCSEQQSEPSRPRPPVAEPAALSAAQPKRRRRRWATITALIIFLVVAVGIAWFGLRDTRHWTPPPEPREGQLLGEGTPSAPDETVETPAVARRYELTIVAQENAWIRVEQDGTLVADTVLPKGQSYTATGAENVRITLRDPSRVRVLRDGGVATEGLGTDPVTITYDESGFRIEPIAIDERAIGPEHEGLLDLNTATVAELEALPGIGPTHARDIVEYRALHRFSRIEDVMDVPGIGAGTFKQIKNRIVVYR